MLLLKPSLFGRRLTNGKFIVGPKIPHRYMRRLENPKKQGDEVVFA